MKKQHFAYKWLGVVIAMSMTAVPVSLFLPHPLSTSGFYIPRTRVTCSNSKYVSLIPCFLSSFPPLFRPPTHGSTRQRIDSRIDPEAAQAVMQNAKCERHDTWTKWTTADFSSCGKRGEEKKVLLLFDFACHPCTGTMLIFSVFLSVCLMFWPKPERNYGEKWSI